MKKITLLLTAIAALFSEGYAQQNTAVNPFLRNSKKQKTDLFHNYVKQVLRHQAHSTANKSTAQAQRVIGISYLDDIYNTTDSTWYLYSGAHTSSYDNDFMAYNDYYFPLYFSPYNYPYDLSVTDVNADSSRYYTLNGSVFEVEDITRAHYSNSEKVLDYDDQSFSGGTSSGRSTYYNIYNSAEELQTVYYLYDNAGTYDSTIKINLYYDGQGRNVSDTIYSYNLGEWDVIQAVTQHYDANNNIDTFSLLYATGGTWIVGVQFINEFYTNNQLKKATLLQYSGTSLMPATIDSFEYGNASANTFSALTEQQFDGVGGSDLYRLQKVFDAQNLVDSMFVYSFDATAGSWVLVETADYSYNSYNNPVSVDYYDPSSASSYVGGERYYYELFTTGVKNLTQELAEMQLYPNPTGNQINITWKNADGKRAIIEVVNAAGQKLVSKSFNWKEATQKMDLGNAAPGMYWLVVRNEQGAVIYRQSVIKN